MSSLVGTFSALLPSFHIEVIVPVSQSLKSITSICWPLLPCWHFETFRARIAGEGLSRSMTISAPHRPFWWQIMASLSLSDSVSSNIYCVFAALVASVWVLDGVMLEENETFWKELPPDSMSSNRFWSCLSISAKGVLLLDFFGLGLRWFCFFSWGFLPSNSTIFSGQALGTKINGNKNIFQNI